MAPRVVLAAALLAACKPDAGAPSPPPPPAPPGAIDAGPPPVDAAIFALFDHLAVRTVKRAAKPYAIALPPGSDRELILAITSEGKAAALAQPVPAPPLPPWMQTRLGAAPITSAAEQGDGSWVAIAGQIVVLVDREHRPEIGLDFGEVRSAIPVIDNPELFEGGDHSFTATVLQLDHVHRSGPVLVVETSLGTSEQRVLLGVDIATGQIAWVTHARTAYTDFVLAGGHAFTSASTGRGWALAAFELSTGAMDRSLPTRGGPYRLSSVDPTTIAGVVPSWQDGGPQPGAPSELTASIDFAPN